MMTVRRVLPALLLVAASAAGAGCLDQVRETVGTEPTHEWTTKSTFQETVDGSNLATGSAPTESRQDSFSVPFGSTDVRMTLDVEVESVGNVTVSLASPSEVVYDRGFDATAEDSFQTQEPDTGEWTVETELQGEATIQVRVDARVPVD